MTLLAVLTAVLAVCSRALDWLLLPGHLAHEAAHAAVAIVWTEAAERRIDLSVAGTSTVEIRDAELPGHAVVLFGLAPTLLGLGIGLALTTWLLAGGLAAPAGLTEQVAAIVALAWLVNLTVPSAADLATAVNGLAGGDRRD